MIKLYRCEKCLWSSSELQSIMSMILRDQAINFVIIEDTKETHRLSKGLRNPIRLEVLVTDGGEVIKDYFELIKWIEKKGLKLC